MKQLTQSITMVALALTPVALIALPIITDAITTLQSTL